MIDWEKEVTSLQELGYTTIGGGYVTIQIPEARQLLWRGLGYFVGAAQWMDGYDEVAEWMSDNNGRGLLLTGPCGTGKSQIGWNILPLVLKKYTGKILPQWTTRMMNEAPERILKEKRLYIDDIGTEGEIVDYGNRRMVFSEVVDEFARRGGLLIASTNLDMEGLAAKYGDRTADRLVSLVKMVEIKGKSLRK